MVLTDAQQDFLLNEFGLTFADVMSMSMDELGELREKCFDIEVAEAVKVDNTDSVESERGTIAAETVDIIFSRLKSMRIT